jgi:hypothetical protein
MVIDCHVPIATWAVGRMPPQEGWAEASSQAHFALLQKIGLNGQDGLVNYLRGEACAGLQINEYNTESAPSLPISPLL